MAKIVPSDLAPSEVVHYSLAGADFDLGARKKTYETADREILGAATAHPWLTVEYDEAEASAPTFVDTQVRPEDDALGAQGPNANIAFDPAEIRKVEDAKAEARGEKPVAIDAGRDQNKAETEGGVAVTLAADSDSDKDKS